MDKVTEKVTELQQSDELKGMLRDIELGVLTKPTLADLIRLGSTNTEQAYNWGNGDNACALTAAWLGARALGYIGK